MSAVPRSDCDPEQPNRPEATSLMAKALADKAELHARIDQRNGAIQAAQQQGADLLEYAWTAADGREADFDVYYRFGESVSLLTAELRRIADRLPTEHERLECEEEFLAEIDAGGDTWERVASFIWEKANFQTGIRRT